MRRLLLLLALIPTSIEVAQTAMCVKFPTIVKADPAQEKCLAVTIYGEARSEPTEGQIAVAFTVLNRAAKGRTLCDVALAPRQYSVFNNNPKLRAIAVSLHLIPEQKNIVDQQSWKQAVEVAQMVSRKYVQDPTNGATHYLASKVMKAKGYRYPKWSKEYKMVKEIENHKFYKDSKA
jgi:N-acetylmuramoyl-L-alanine amidase